jgi:eukaryotic-like serine/threonine-protein kinase
MPLEPRSRLGPYEIESAIGAGGMGEVYRARDTRLDRVVAIKVLPSHLSSDAGLRERFEREARAVSSLNHPHICTLHDVGSEDGVDFLVMEYLEGETLAARIQKGPLALDEALRYGTQIADALEKAHREGVVHRDLKPGNVMITPSGAKLLDFGLAKHAGSRGAPDSSLSALPTEAQPLTREGAILGTFQYMSPEQLEGQEADARSDIFALGAVLYEMLMGKKAFTGKSQASLISAIMTGEPPAMATLKPMTPAPLDHVVRRCLAKAPDKRWQSAADVARELEWVGESKSSPATTKRWSERGMWGMALPVAAALLVGAGVATWWSRGNEAPRAPVQRYEIPLPADQVLTRLGRHVLALSPDGNYLVFNSNDELRLRPVNDVDSRPIPGTTGATEPFFSPESQWIGFWADDKLQRVSTNGGAPVTLCPAENPFGASWAEDGTVVFGQSDGIYRVPGTGGQAQRIITVEGVQLVSGPTVLPGGRALLYNVYVTDWDAGSRIMIHSFETGENRVLIEGGSDARYVPTGHLVYALDNTLLASAFDLDEMEIVGGPVSVVEDVSRGVPAIGAAQFTFSSQGTMVFLKGYNWSNNRLVWSDRSGRLEPLPFPDGQYESPALSPDGKRLAITKFDQAGSDLWIYDIEREALSKLTFSGDADYAVWSADGTRLAFSSGSPSNVVSVVADGSEPPERLTTHDDLHIPTSWSADGLVLAVNEWNRGNGGLYFLPMRDGATLEPFLDSTFTEREARFSPDDRWIAYRSGESGRDEVYVRSYPDGAGRQQISTNGGAQPVWNPKGGELFYKEGDRMMVVDVQTGKTFRASKPRVLYESRFPERTPGDPARFAVTPDGERFLVTVPAEDASRKSRFQVVVNWFDELRERVPVEN